MLALRASRRAQAGQHQLLQLVVESGAGKGVGVVGVGSREHLDATRVRFPGQREAGAVEVEVGTAPLG